MRNKTPLFLHLYNELCIDVVASLITPCYLIRVLKFLGIIIAHMKLLFRLLVGICASEVTVSMIEDSLGDYLKIIKKIRSHHFNLKMGNPNRLYF